MVNKISQYMSPPKKERLPEKVATQIKRLILCRKIGMGDKLPAERELTQILQVSRTVIRQALTQLEQSGFIEIKTGQKGGAFIINESYKPIENYIKDLLYSDNLKWSDFFETREVIEVYNINRAFEKASAKNIHSLRSINSRIINELRTSNYQDWTKKSFHSIFCEADKDFHIAISCLSGNLLMVGITQSLLQNLLLYLFEKKSEMFSTNLQIFIKNMYIRHEEIIDAIEKKDKKKCIALIKKDVGQFRDIGSF